MRKTSEASKCTSTPPAGAVVHDLDEDSALTGTPLRLPLTARRRRNSYAVTGIRVASCSAASRISRASSNCASGMVSGYRKRITFP